MSKAPGNPTSAGLDLDALPAWAREVLGEKWLDRPAAPAVTNFSGGSSWPTFVSAAAVSSFLPRDLMIDSDLDEAHRQDAERNVLTFAEEVHGPEGSKWALTQDARRSVLMAASEKEIQEALARTESRFVDPISIALRGQLSATQVSLESTSLPVLEATRVAATWLSGLKEAQPLDLDELGREIALRRLLKPFRRMVGADSSEGAQIDQSKVRFFGREVEIKKLRDYVGVVPATTLLETVGRFAAGVARRVRGARPMFIWGIGGVGKTALIAKFVLEHAEVARSRYPLAYLDFDRASLSARRPELLLAEMCGQVGAQFRELTEPMRALQDKCRALSAALDAAPEKAAPDSNVLKELGAYLPEGSRDIATFAGLLPLLTDFREAVDAHIASLESMFELKRPFLLVFDTFEIVQYSDVDVRRVEDFVRVLTKSSNGLGWPRIRLIVSGRKKPEKFLDPEGNEEIALGALDRPGCVQMLLALAKDASRPIGDTDAERLVDAMIASLGAPKSVGLHPLSLKLLGNVFESAKDVSGGALVSQLIGELRDQPSGDATLRKALIDGILVRRILGHVADERVRALADPGLVVRRITPAVIRDVMALGTPKPGSSKEDIDGDGLGFARWQLSAVKQGSPARDEAEEIFDAFGTEVSLVETDEKGLRHRQDLRQEMLPLIKARRPNRFDLLHKLAFAYFEGEALSHPEDWLSCGEAIYHGLWLGTAIKRIDRLWPKSPGFDPRLDPEEFSEMPEARRYIRAKTRQPLSEAEIAGLPQSIAIEWLISRNDTFLEDDHPNDVARTVRAATGANYQGLDTHVSTAAIVARLLYRTGQWNECQQLVARHLVDTGYIETIVKSGALIKTSSGSDQGSFDDLLTLLRIWVTMSAKLGADPLPLDAGCMLGNANSGFVRDRLIQTELLSFAVLGNRVLKHRSDWPAERRIDVGRQTAQAASEVRASSWRGNGRTLRYAILATEENLTGLLGAYLDINTTPPRDEEARPFVGRVLANAYREFGDPAVADEIEEYLEGHSPPAIRTDYLASLWQTGRDLILKSLRTQPAQELFLKKVVAFDHHDWIRALGNALSRAFDGERGQGLRKALISQALLADLPDRSLTVDGLSIVQWASARGNLLRLASTIDEFSDEFSLESGDTSASYPETVFGIAEALLLWHDVNLEALGEVDEPPPPPPRASVRPSAVRKKESSRAKKRVIKTMRRKK